MLLIDAVNRCLRAIGEIKIPDGVDIDSLDPLHEASQIRDILLDANKDLQTEGWYFNREDWEFLPDSNDKIDIPVTVLAIEGLSTQVVRRGNNLYDVANKTLIFTESIECDTIFELDFEETPESFAQWVMWTAAKEAQMLLKGDDLIDEKIEVSLSRAFLKFEKEHMRNKSYNLITQSRLIDRTSNPTALG